MERRSILKGAGLAVGTLATSGIALNHSTGQATATGGVSLDSVTVSSDDGTVQHVSIYGDSVIDWDGFETAANSFEVVSSVVIKDGEGTEVWSGTINETGARDLNNDSWGGSGETHTGPGTSGTITSDVGLDDNGEHDPSTDWAIIQASGYDDPYGLPANPAPADVLEVDTDGASASFVVELTSTYTWYATADGSDQIHTKDFTSEVSVTVENEPTEASSSSGEGADGATAA